MRLLFRALMVAAVAGVLGAVSWALAANTVAGVLGSPPPDMGDRQTVFLWRGAAEFAGRPRVWRFTYAGTQIPATPRVRIYVSPLGKLLRTDPADLGFRIKVWKMKGFS